MIELLSKFFIKNRGDASDPAVRRAYGMLSGIVGIFFNLSLFTLKFIAGVISGAISITADAFNNLSDAGSSLITLLGFKLSGAKPDPDHPFGHGRFEYLCGFTVSLLIIVMGIELGKSSVIKILHPASVVFRPVIIIILAIAIAIKFYMYLYNRRLFKKFDSVSIKATAADSLSDCVATTVVLIATVVSRVTTFNVDAWCGVLVSLFILWQGYNAAKDTLSPLLGNPPSKAFVAQIEALVMSSPDVLGIHDLVVHDYGPGRVMISLHAEVPGNGDLGQLHDAIDLIEHKLKDTLRCEAVIHMDPISHDDRLVSQMHLALSDMAKTIDENITVHDFRMVSGPTHTNLIFDMVVPLRFRLDDDEIRETICHLAKQRYGNNFYCVITIDKPYC